jgi:hypothetical protein
VEVIALLQLTPVLVDVDTIWISLSTQLGSNYTQNKSNSTCSLVWAANMEAIMAIT